jgi:hypothetical protein
MQTTISPSLAANHSLRTARPSLLTQFLNWAAGQESSRFGWLAGILATHGCVVTPIVILIVAATGMNLVLFITAMAAMGLALTTNLAAMPTRITIPAFFLSLVIDLLVIAACFFTA